MPKDSLVSPICFIAEDGVVWNNTSPKTLRDVYITVSEVYVWMVYEYRNMLWLTHLYHVNTSWPKRRPSRMGWSTEVTDTWVSRGQRFKTLDAAIFAASLNSYNRTRRARNRVIRNSRVITFTEVIEDD
jgi:hypothetical protein